MSLRQQPLDRTDDADRADDAPHLPEHRGRDLRLADDRLLVLDRDALVPAIDAFERALRSGEDLVGAAGRARAAAEDGMRATVPLQARKGRASYLGPRSVGHQDPGATSTALLFTALERTASRGDAT